MRQTLRTLSTQFQATRPKSQPQDQRLQSQIQVVVVEAYCSRLAMGSKVLEKRLEMSHPLCPRVSRASSEEARSNRRYSENFIQHLPSMILPIQATGPQRQT